MGIDVKILTISHGNVGLLKSFVESLDEEQKSFRYYENRSFDVLKNHLFTCLLTRMGKAVGYGHLDREDGVVWLGIVVKKEFQGRGMAKEIMEALITKAKELGLQEIRLSVDFENTRAIALYERYGFEVISKKENHYVLKKEMNLYTKQR